MSKMSTVKSQRCLLGDIIFSFSQFLKNIEAIETAFSLTSLSSHWRTYLIGSMLELGFPHSSVGKDSTCKAGDPSLIPGSGRSTGEGIGYPFQYSWASFVLWLSW